MLGIIGVVGYLERLRSAHVTRMNYGLLALSFLLCGIGLVLEFVFLEPIGFLKQMNT